MPEKEEEKEESEKRESLADGSANEEKEGTAINKKRKKKKKKKKMQFKDVQVNYFTSGPSHFVCTGEREMPLFQRQEEEEPSMAAYVNHPLPPPKENVYLSALVDRALGVPLTQHVKDYEELVVVAKNGDLYGPVPKSHHLARQLRFTNN